MYSRLSAIALLLVLAPASLSAQSKPVQKVSRYGDVEISGQDRIRGKTDLSGIRITGTKTLIIVPDKKSGSVLRIHADEIQTKSAGNDTFATAELSGNVRYTLTQTNAEGTRTLDGTAGRASFRRSAQEIILFEGVQATLTDPAHLAKPGLFSTNRVVADLSQKSIRYTLTGSASENDLRFTPKARSGKPDTKTQVSETHIYGFREGSFQVGQTAEFRGEGTTADLLNPDGKATSQVRANAVETHFTATDSRIKSAVATGNVRYHVTRPNRDNKSEETLDGTAESATLDYLGDLPRYVLKGSVETTVYTPDRLLEPAHLTADRVEVVQIAENKEEHFIYKVFSGGSGKGLLTFTPLPAPPVEGRNPPFKFGKITLTQWTEGTLETGRTFTLTGNRLVFESDDQESGAKAKLVAKKIVGQYGQEGDRKGILASATATGEVEFTVNQPPVKEIAGKVKAHSAQSLSGKSVQIVFTNNKEERVIALEGPLTAQLTDPDNLVKPGVITGKKGDVLKLILIGNTYDFDIDSPNQTATISFEPKPKPQDVTPKPTVLPNKPGKSSKPDKAMKTEKAEKSGK